MRKYHLIADVSGYQKPRIMIQKNSSDKLVFCLLDWNTKESEEGWSSDEISELILTLQNSLEKSKHINSNENTEFLFNSTWDL